MRRGSIGRVAEGPGEHVFDITAPETIRDPYPGYRWLRDEAPVHRVEMEATETGIVWFVSRHEDVRAVMADDRMANGEDRIGKPRVSPPILMFQDPPEHTRLRKPVASAFTRRRVERLRDGIAADVRRLSAPFLEGGPVDVFDTLARSLPLLTIVRLLGLQEADAPRLHLLARRILDMADMATRDDEERRRQGFEAQQELRERVADAVAAKRHDPGDDLLSALLTTEADGVVLEPQEIVFLGTQMFVNGHETTINLIATGLYRLLEAREPWERLVADPSCAPTAVEECLRFEAPTQRAMPRYTLEPVTIAGVTIPARQQVSGLIGAANRDERVFPAPDVIDVGRHPNPHLTFGHGRHHCPGAALSRVQFEEVLRHLTAAVPDLELAGEEPVFRLNSLDRGLESLTVARGG